uniref:Thiosulfate sulfurtransferase n=1 Tax=Salarias fasciatus TaxID=181472 RepID=A0A672I7B0_SALFA
MAVQAEALVSAQWLANMVKRNLVGPRLRILDASWHLPVTGRDAKKEFAQSHIPGASFFDIDECTDRDSPLDHSLPSEEFFSEYVGNLGIGSDSHVVVYDASDLGAFSSTRVWWMFRLFGHLNVSWSPGTAARSQPESAEFTATMNRSWVRAFEDVAENITAQKFQLVDVRSYGRFRGLEPEPREDIPPGHIPGSKCMPFDMFLGEDGKMLPTEKLKKFFEESQVDLGKPLCGSCGSGVTVCHMVLAAHLCGVPGVPVYVGSWFEWFSKAPPEHKLSEAKN